MPKRPRYDDKFRASAFVMLEAAGYPDTKGALMRVSRRLKVPHPTLSRWFRHVRNPPPNEVVHEKKIDFLQAIKGELSAILAEMPNARPDASHKELATAFGIMFDKVQLLENKPTGIVQVVNMLKDGRINPDQVRDRFPSIADELFAQAGVAVD